jgi:hypothetical protein
MCLISHFIISFAFYLVKFACQYPNSGIKAILVDIVNTQKLFVYTVTIHVYGTIHIYGTIHPYNTIHPYGTVHIRYCLRIKKVSAVIKYSLGSSV